MLTADQEKGTVTVNLSPQLEVLMQEVRFFRALGFEIPLPLADVYHRGVVLMDMKRRLTRTLQEVVELETRLSCSGPLGHVLQPRLRLAKKRCVGVVCICFWSRIRVCQRLRLSCR